MGGIDLRNVRCVGVTVGDFGADARELVGPTRDLYHQDDLLQVCSSRSRGVLWAADGPANAR